MDRKKLDRKELYNKRMPIYRKIIRTLWALILLGIIGVFVLFFTLSKSIPSFEELENPVNDYASEVFAANGQVLGRYYIEDRIPVSFNELSPYLEQALVATEDERFYKHSGIDIEGLGRVLVKTVLLQQRNAGGGSTITQQLAKLLYSDRNFKGMNKLQKIKALFTKKFREWITAIKLEKSYTKHEIIAMYLNQFNFINGAYGIKAASEIYFGKSQDSLRIEEAATLVGMLQNPSLYNPIRRPDTTKHRRMVVLSQMKKNHIISQEVYDSLKVLPLDMAHFKRASHSSGLAPYFRMELRKKINSILRKKDNYKSDGTPYNIFTDGLKIYTTIDPLIQAHAEKAMLEHMKQLQKKFWKTWKNKDPWTYREEETTDEEMAAREKKMTKLIRETDRYAASRNKYLKDIIEKTKKLHPNVKFRDVDIDRMLNEEKKKGYLTKLVNRKLITPNMAANYKAVIKGENWGTLKIQWRKLQKKVKEEFNTKTKMPVFAYNDRLETDTIMTPLDSIKYHHNFLQLGSLAVDPVTGYIKAWIGGINHKYFPLDHTTVNRQVGSTFKPFIYATAISQQGISPCFRVKDIARTIFPGEGNFHLKEEWTPQNAKEEYSGETLTLRDALKKSVNTVSVFLMKQIGDVKPVRQLVKNMGIDADFRFPNGRYKVPKAPSICLGATDLTVHEMTGAYTTFANNGIFNKPTFITRIEDRQGHVIYQQIPDERVALEAVPNYVMVQMLKYAAGWMGFKTEAGGKTGTTNDFVDGWFMGITPNLVVGTWVGGDDRWIRFLSLRNGQGARMAKPFFKKFIKSLEDDEEVGFDTKAQFPVPEGASAIEFDCDAYEHITPTDTLFDQDDFYEDMFDDDSTNISDDIDF